MKDRKQLLISISLNALVVIFSIIGLILKINETKLDYCLTFSFYVYVLTIIVWSVFIYQEIYNLRQNKDIKDSIKYNKYIITAMQALIMVYWIGLIAPLAGNDFLGEYLFKKGSLFLHVLSPLISIICLLGYDEVEIKKKETLSSLIPTITYGLVIIILNIFHILIGPYGFFEIHYSPIGVIILTPIGLLLIQLVIGYILYLCKNAANKVKKQIN